MYVYKPGDYYSKTNQMQQFLKFIYFCMTLYMFRSLSVHHQEFRTFIQQHSYVKQIRLPNYQITNNSIY
jgi:hypothetical protein